MLVGTFLMTTTGAFGLTERKPRAGEPERPASVAYGLPTPVVPPSFSGSDHDLIDLHTAYIDHNLIDHGGRNHSAFIDHHGHLDYPHVRHWVIGVRVRLVAGCHPGVL